MTNIPILFTTYNRLEYSKKSLQALIDSDCGDIIVVDNYSTDGTVEWLQSLNHTKVKIILNSKNEGVAGAMNIFLEWTKDYHVVGKVDNDTIVPKDWCVKLKNKMDALQIDIIQAKHHILKETHPKGFDSWMQTMTQSRIDNSIYYNSFVGGSGILFNREKIHLIPQTEWKLYGWFQFQKQHPEMRKAFCSDVEIELLDTDSNGAKYEIPDYYQETGRAKKSVLPQINFVTASHVEDILQNNLLKSPIFKNKQPIIKRGYTNVPKAYNDANIKGLINVFIHHDVFLPDTFYLKLYASIEEINKVDPNWGVLGVAGVQRNGNKKDIYGNILDRGIQWGGPELVPHEVDTLDELLLITKGDFVFDENLPSNHFYGGDICLQAKKQGRKNYAIQAYCHHNSLLPQGGRPDNFMECQEYFRKKWIDELPIFTTCANIFN